MRSCRNGGWRRRNVQGWETMSVLTFGRGLWRLVMSAVHWGTCRCSFIWYILIYICISNIILPISIDWYILITQYASSGEPAAPAFSVECSLPVDLNTFWRIFLQSKTDEGYEFLMHLGTWENTKIIWYTSLFPIKIPTFIVWSLHNWVLLLQYWN